PRKRPACTTNSVFFRSWSATCNRSPLNLERRNADRGILMKRDRKEMVMTKRVRITTVAVVVFLIIALGGVVFSSSPKGVPDAAHYMPQFNESGEMILPPNNIWREWVYVGSPLTPNGLNGGKAGFPEYHNVYIQPWAYEQYKKTNQFPDGTIMFKEL